MRPRSACASLWRTGLAGVKSGVPGHAGEERRRVDALQTASHEAFSGHGQVSDQKQTFIQSIGQPVNPSLILKILSKTLNT
jgi:hypothetical protein